MISTEERKVLESLASGKISLETAVRLLDETRAGQSWPVVGQNSTPTGRLRFLRIAVDEPGKDQVNVKFPIEFLRKGISLLGILSPEECEKLADIIDRERGEPREHQLLMMLKSLDFSINPDGKKSVRVSLE